MGMLWGLERCENEQLTPRAWYPTTAHVVGELEPVRPRVRPSERPCTDQERGQNDNWTLNAQFSTSGK